MSMNLLKRLLILLAVFLLSASGCRAEKLSVGEYRVARVIDGDTIRLANGQEVRYLGIDTPESRKRSGGAWIYDPEPFAAEAVEFNAMLVGGKAVTLEFDTRKRDKYGRILAYVRQDGKMVNAMLIRNGYASVYTFPPNVKYLEYLVAQQNAAIEERLGIWSDLEEALPGRLSEHIGRYVALTGSVSDVRASRGLLYLIMDPGGASAAIREQNMVLFEKQGVFPSRDYQGKRIRILGKVEDWGTPVVVLDNPSQVSVLDPGRGG
ncbi:MAG: hypothetical protein GF408_02320 [Candidatus Omnitrophica bacterium]|nr:hypothetical protein [Candidatus Omnitrophota bacterium]